MANFIPALKKTLLHEGGYVNDPEDPVGETNYGVSKSVAVAHGYTGPMIDIPMEVVERIYKTSYWDKLWLDQCTSQMIAEELFDTAVNQGVSTAVRHLQNVLNFLNRDAELWPDLIVDGIMGNKTFNALKRAIHESHRYAAAVLIALRGEQYLRYREIVQKNPRMERFFLGWILNRV